MIIIVYNVQFQICGLVIVCMVMFFYFSNKTLQIFSERMYSVLLVAVFLCLLLDISSIVAINWKDRLPKLMVDIICKSYIVSITNVAMIIRLYVFTNITHKKIETKFKIYYTIPLLINVIICTMLPIYYVVGDGKIYTYGIIIYVTYTCIVIYILTSVYQILRWRKEISQYHFRAISFLLCAWATTAILQFAKNEWLLVGFSLAASMVFMYFCLENPSQNIDSVTGIFNQSAYHLYINNLCNQNKEFVLLVLSVRNMGFINETFGIQNSDKFLQDVAIYLEGQTKGVVFRDLGAKFTLVIDKDFEEVPTLIKDLLNRFRQTWAISNLKYKANVSIVQMLASDCKYAPEKLVELSRDFLSNLKKSREEGYLKVTQEQIAEKEKKYLIEKTLKRVIKDKDIEVFYQPIFSIKEQKYVSAEALTRIKDEEGNYIRPDLFIHVAEQNGMILELGMLIFEEVCQFINKNNLEGLGIQYIEVNLSIVQCMQEKLADELIELMERYHIAPGFINLEITETAAVNSSITLQNNMEKLMKKGVTFSLDDYGTGYSNLSYVIDLPVNLIKIDRSMILAYCNIEKARIAMEFTISMIKGLGFEIVAEGVETEEQLEKVKKLEIDYIQGFYFSKPLEKSDFWEELVRKDKHNKREESENKCLI